MPRFGTILSGRAQSKSHGDMAKEIIAWREGHRDWYITIDGRRHPSGFVSIADIRSWVGTMQTAGLYCGRVLLVPNEKTGRLEEVDPLY